MKGRAAMISGTMLLGACGGIAYQPTAVSVNKPKSEAFFEGKAVVKYCDEAGKTCKQGQEFAKKYPFTDYMTKSYQSERIAKELTGATDGFNCDFWKEGLKFRIVGVSVTFVSEERTEMISDNKKTPTSDFEKACTPPPSSPSTSAEYQASVKVEFCNETGDICRIPLIAAKTYDKSDYTPVESEVDNISREMDLMLAAFSYSSDCTITASIKVMDKTCKEGENCPQAKPKTVQLKTVSVSKTVVLMTYKDSSYHVLQVPNIEKVLDQSSKTVISKFCKSANPRPKTPHHPDSGRPSPQPI